MERTPKERLYWLLASLYRDKKIETEVFCNEFHITYDHDLNEPLTELEDTLFEEMAIIAARYSQFEEDHFSSPGVFYSDEDVEKMAQQIFETF